MQATDFKNKKVMVFGWARSGKAAAQLLTKLGSRVTVVNGDEFDAQDATYRALLAADVALIGTDNSETLDSTYDYLIKNPGINYDHPLVQKAEKLNIPILTEVEVALSTFKGRLIAVTGSNGKTTTTSLIRDMLKADGQNVITAGNIGVPVSEVVFDLTQEDTLLLELSSFQLLGLPDIQPDIALITNIFSNHLDYHKTRANYVAAKFRITRNQNANQYLILNAEGKDTENFKNETEAQVLEFSRTKQHFPVAFSDDNLIMTDEIVMPTKDIKLVGPHNQENILAAVTVANLAGVSKPAIREVLKTFSGVAHRLQYLFTAGDVKYYNDSKATDIEATQTALDSFDCPTIWIGGGLERSDNLERLLPNLKNVKAVIAVGETQQKIVTLAREAGKPVIAVTDVEHAAPVAVQLASPGDVVLLSPAQASWDQYSSFEERGDNFVASLKETLNSRED